MVFAASLIVYVGILMMITEPVQISIYEDGVAVWMRDLF